MIPFQDNSNIIVSGCSGSGKTVFVKNLLKYRDQLFLTPITHVLFIYKHWQREYDEIESMKLSVSFMDTLPTEEEVEKWTACHQHSIMICDDMLTEIMNNEFICNLFTRLSHNFKVTTVLLLQNISMNGKYRSMLCKNAHVNVLMRSARDNYSLRSLGQQLGEYNILKFAYKDATDVPFGYLICDTHPNTDRFFRYRTNIFPFDTGMLVYE